MTNLILMYRTAAHYRCDQMQAQIAPTSSSTSSLSHKVVDPFGCEQCTEQWLPDTIQVKGKVQCGFEHGSRYLGTPTANLLGTLLDDVPEEVRDGVYRTWDSGVCQCIWTAR